jgi:uncharacterized membrane protein YqgA involved in biofilm formation
MTGLGTLINTGAIIAGGILGLLSGSRLKDNYRLILNQANGVAVVFIGISGALESYGDIKNGSLVIIGCLAIGTFLGELFNLEGLFERFGEWLKQKTGNAKDKQFVDAFVTASLTVCIGAMAIVGAIEDGISGDISILTTKAVLDFIIIIVMTCALGKGCMFSALPVAALQGSVTFLARLVRPVLTTAALTNLSVIGSLLIFCVGINLVWGKKIRVANMLPAVILAVVTAFLPF